MTYQMFIGDAFLRKRETELLSGLIDGQEFFCSSENCCFPFLLFCHSDTRR